MINGYLDQYEIKELRQDINQRKRSGAFELPDSNKRATWRTNEHGDKILTSYYTDVCSIDKNGNFKKLWFDYSVTTMKHINTFRKMNGLDSLNKAAWMNL